jgi:septal ring factor EnvC (AmiA/AmiB activator)
VVATGRTGSGKTTLANRLLGVDYFLSSGRQDCTREVNHVRFPGGLSYSDLPGACSDDLLENVNRLALGLPQVDDAPPAVDLTIARYAPDRPPVLDRLAPEQINGSGIAPDLILYLVAADKQFTSVDRRYLVDLLRRHSQVIFILNVFATSPPSEPNVRDIVTRVAEAHRRVRPDVPGPRIVLLDCRTGEGLGELLEASRQILGGTSGELFADVLGDVDRATPRCFARELAAYLFGKAEKIRGASGPAEPRHPLRIAALEVFDQVAEYAGTSRAGGRMTLSRIHPIVADASKSQDSTSSAGPRLDELANELGQLARRLEAELISQVTQERDAIRAIIDEWFRAETEVINRRMEEIGVRESRIAARAEQFAAENENLQSWSKTLDEQSATHSEAVRDLQRQSATLDIEIDAHNYEFESHRDRVDDFNDLIHSIQRAGGAEPEDARRLESESDRLNRIGRRLDRESESLNSKSYRLRSDLAEIREQAEALDEEIDRYNQAVRELNGRIAGFRGERKQLNADRLALGRMIDSARIAQTGYLTRYYESYRELTDRLAVLRDRIVHGHQRSRQAVDLSIETLVKWRSRLLAEAANVSEALAVIRRNWNRFLVERLVDRVILDRIVDHFDEADSGAHRGSTTEPVQIEGELAVLAAAMTAAPPGDPFTWFNDLKAEAGHPPDLGLDSAVFVLLVEHLQKLIS